MPTLGLLFASIGIAVLAMGVPHCRGYTIKEDESFLQQPHYASQEQLEDLFAGLEKAYPNQAKVHFLGRSLEGRNLLALQISRNTRSRNLLTPPVKYIANMHGDETVGRQLLVYMAQYLLGNHERISDLGQLVNSTDIYLVPTMNPDGYALSQVKNAPSLHLLCCFVQLSGKINKWRSRSGRASGWERGYKPERRQYCSRWEWKAVTG